MTRPTAAVLLGMALAGGGAVAQTAHSYPEWRPLPVDLKSEAVLRARLGLEYRRAGGSRRIVVERILMDGRTDDTHWTYHVTTACVDERVDCAPFVPIVRSILNRPLRAEERAYIEHSVTLIERQAYLQGLPASIRNSVFKRPIEGDRVNDPKLRWLDADNAALLALREGLDDLLPLIRTGLTGRLRLNRSSIETALLVREAVISQDPPMSLLALIRDGVEFVSGFKLG